MNLSSNGVDFIKSHEGLSLVAYKGAGETYWTIGYGHYGSDVYEGMTITEAQAEALLIEDLAEFVAYTNDIALAKFPNMNQNQFDALVSYCYNRGPGASDGSNGLRQLIYNSDTLEEVSNNFLVYWGTNTSAYEGLMNRRRAEKELFDSTYSGGGSGSITPPTKKKNKYNFVLFNQRRRFQQLCKRKSF